MIHFVVPGCSNPSSKGEDWQTVHEPLPSYRLGIELRLTLRDIAVVLTLCDDHAAEPLIAAWRQLIDKLSEWGWKPL